MKMLEHQPINTSIFLSIEIDSP